MAENLSAQEVVRGLKGLSESFGDATGIGTDEVAAIHEKARETAKTIHAKDEKILSDGSYENSGYIAGTVQAGTIFEQSDSGEGKAQRDIMLQILLDQLQANLVYWEGVRADAEHNIKLAEDRLEEIDRQVEAIHQALDYIDDHEAVELKEDGTLANDDAEKALRDYEKRTGLSIDRNNTSAVERALKAHEKYIDNEEREELEQTIHENKQKRDVAKAKIKGIEEQIENLKQEPDANIEAAEDFLSKMSQDPAFDDLPLFAENGGAVNAVNNEAPESKPVSSAADAFTVAVHAPDQNDDLFEDPEADDLFGEPDSGDLFAEADTDELFNDFETPGVPAAPKV